MSTLEYLAEIRQVELQRIARHLPAKARILEIGAGTGHQSQALMDMGHEVVPIEIPDSNYAHARVVPIADYDGSTLPVPDRSIDVVFSSNVLEHVADLECMHAEIRRVLKPQGYCIHVMPTPSWRFWCTLASYGVALRSFVELAPQLLPRRFGSGELVRLAKAWDTMVRRCGRYCLPRRHGERGNAITELFYFSPHWWRRNFSSNGYEMLQEESMGLFYTGNYLLWRQLSFSLRGRMARYLGSATRLYKVRPLP